MRMRHTGHSGYGLAMRISHTPAHGAYGTCMCACVLLWLWLTGLDATSDTKCVCDTHEKTNEYGAYAYATALRYAKRYALRG